MTYLCDDKNEYGTPTSVHICAECGNVFVLTPATPEERWGNYCFGGTAGEEQWCRSYEASRDLSAVWDAVQPWVHSSDAEVEQKLHPTDHPQ